MHTLAAKVLNRMLEAADEACADFGAKMGIGFNNRTADEIKFSLDNEDQIRQKLDNVTDEVDFNEITDAIRNNVTNAALAEIDRSQKEKEAADQLEEVLRNNDEITTEESVQEVLKDRKPADDVPSLMESIMIGKSKTFTESTSREEWDKMFRFVFDKYLMDLRNGNESSHIYTYFYKYMSEEYKKETPLERVVIDYIAGMTDEFMLREYELCLTLIDN